MLHAEPCRENEDCRNARGEAEAEPERSLRETRRRKWKSVHCPDQVEGVPENLYTIPEIFYTNDRRIFTLIPENLYTDKRCEA